VRRKSSDVKIAKMSDDVPYGNILLADE